MSQAMYFRGVPPQAGSLVIDRAPIRALSEASIAAPSRNKDLKRTSKALARAILDNFKGLHGQRLERLQGVNPSCLLTLTFREDQTTGMLKGSLGPFGPDPKCPWVKPPDLAVQKRAFNLVARYVGSVLGCQVDVLRTLKPNSPSDRDLSQPAVWSLFVKAR